MSSYVPSHRMRSPSSAVSTYNRLTPPADRAPGAHRNRIMKTARLSAFLPGMHLMLGVVACVLTTTSAHAVVADRDQMVYAGPHTSIAVPIYKSRIIELPSVAKRVSIGNPDIADVLIFNSTELYVLGKDLGTTNVLLWDPAGALVSTISVTVTHDIDGLRERLDAILPGEK